MKELKKCVAVALSEMGKLRFSGATLIPAGNVMSALTLAGEEINRLEVEEQKRQAEAKREKPEEEQDGENS